MARPACISTPSAPCHSGRAFSEELIMAYQLTELKWAAFQDSASVDAVLAPFSTGIEGIRGALFSWA